MTNYTNVFGNTSVSPAQPSYQNLSMATSQTLNWPLEASTAQPYFAAQIDVNASVGSLTITLPDATQGTPGATAIFNNVGAHDVNILDASGGAVQTVATGTNWVIYLRTNSIAAGTWGSEQLGATTSTATASALAGAGLEALLAKLAVILTPVTKSGATSITQTYWANEVINTGAANNAYTLDLAANLTAGFFVWFKNNGSGTMTIACSGGETIDGNATVVLRAGGGTLVVCSGATFYSSGNSVTTPISVANGGTGATTQAGAQTNLGLGTMCTQSASNVAITGGTVTLLDTNFTLQDNGDTSKQLQFDVAGVTTATTRTVAVPDANGTMVLASATQTLTNKTLTSPVMTAASTDSLAVTGGSAPANGIYLPAANTLGITTNSSRAITIASNQRVNINTTTTTGAQLAVTGPNSTLQGLQVNNTGEVAFTIQTGPSNGTYATGWSATDTALFINKNNSSSRSVNAAGTLNASGADYAEYERKADTCGIVEKGQIIGFDKDGKITDRFADAVSFGVKSTDPSYVGGDSWGSDIIVGPRPQYPAPREVVYDGPLPLGPAPVKPALVIPRTPLPQMGEEEAGFAMRRAQWADAMKQAQADFVLASGEYQRAMAHYQAELDAYNAAQAAHNIQLSAAQAEFESAVEQHERDWTAFQKKLEIERATVDRIAYAGKVPVNVTGAKIGDYIVPVDNNGAIGGACIEISGMSLAQYAIAVGQVRSILADGRARIAVKVG